MGVLTQFTPVSIDTSILKRFFPTTRVVIILRRCRKAPLILKITIHKKELLFLLHSTKTNTLRATQRAFCTQLYTKPHRNVDICVPLCKQHKHSQQLQHNFMSVRLFCQTSNLGFEIAPLSAAMSCTNNKWKLGRVAQCTVVSKIHAVEL